MWSRVRHRRLQALSLVALAALLTTSLCLGPLYQRAMEQALAGSGVATASPEQTAIRFRSGDLRAGQLEADLPDELPPLSRGSGLHHLGEQSRWCRPAVGAVATRLYAASTACERPAGRPWLPSAARRSWSARPTSPTNGWTVGSQVPFRNDWTRGSTPSRPSRGTVTVVGVYEPASDEDWLGAPITGGPVPRGPGRRPRHRRLAHRLRRWPGRPAPPPDLAPDHLLGGVVSRHRRPRRPGRASDPSSRASNGRGPPRTPAACGLRIATDIPPLSEQVATGSEQGRTTVVVLVVQLLVLVAVVLWMVLVAATDDRRPEVALARLRGRGRRGAAAYLLSELLPLTLVGVAVGIPVAPLVMAVVARVLFPVPVPRELPGGFVLAALGSAVSVPVVVLAAARRAVREPVDSLLRAVPARHSGSGAGAAEIALIVFALTAVVALVTGNLEGPLATLAPTLLAVAGGLLLGRGLAPATRLVSRRLLRNGRAVAAAGIVNAVRRPAARRVLVMVVVASALFVFCVDALVTGKHNRQNAAEQQNGAPYSLAIQATRLNDVVAAARGGRPGPPPPDPRGDDVAGHVDRGADRGRGRGGVPTGGLLPRGRARTPRMGRDQRRRGPIRPC